MQLRVERLEFGVIERMSLVRGMGLIGQMEMRVWLTESCGSPDKRKCRYRQHNSTEFCGLSEMVR